MSGVWWVTICYKGSNTPLQAAVFCAAFSASFSLSVNTSLHTLGHSICKHTHTLFLLEKVDLRFGTFHFLVFSKSVNKLFCQTQWLQTYLMANDSIRHFSNVVFVCSLVLFKDHALKLRLVSSLSFQGCALTAHLSQILNKSVRRIWNKRKDQQPTEWPHCFSPARNQSFCS